ncbi:MAG: hypothetical protein PHT81_05060 [Endomicrobiaceae bacterium]|nr:hypothetical protein [Endomicrobiaceae bacterium]MDD3922796.1 hypothetical protein [Endomicrobiaceae bacterium]
MIINITKKTSLIILGVLISFVILEIGLQIAGFTLTTIKKSQNKQTNDPNAITILCLGESTTDRQWPPILQKILNKKIKDKKINVIDEGHAGKNSEYLYYEIVQKKLLQYNPDIVVSMIGINDKMSDKPYIVNQGNWYSKFKIYKLLILLKDHISYTEKYTILNSAALNENVPKAIINKILFFSVHQDKKHNVLIEMKKIIKKYPKIHYYESMVPALVNPYFYEIILKKDNYIFNIQDFINYYKLNTEYLELSHIYVFFAQNFLKVNDKYNAVLCAKTSLRYSNCTNAVNNIIKLDNNNNIYPRDKYIRVNRYKQYYNITNIIYTAIVKMIVEKNMNFIAMQYPTLPINDLKNTLKNSKYYDQLIFISNEENFKEALKNHKKEEIFVDMFGGSFGHCTDFGNTLIAENVAKTIEEILKYSY